MEDKSTTGLISIAASSSRGAIIHLTIEIENIINIYISELLTKDEAKSEEMIGLILGPRMSFESKKQVFIHLLNKYNPDFIKSRTSLDKDLVTIMEKRNVFAHYPVDYSLMAQEHFIKNNVIYFVKIKNGKNQEFEFANRIPYTEIDINNFVKFVEDVFNFIKPLIDLGTALPPK